MHIPIGLQLYSVREQLANDFERTLEAVALAGYDGVELAGLHNRKSEQVAQLLNNLHLEVIGMHCDVISSDGLKQSLETAAALNCTNLICPWTPPETFKNESSIRDLAEQLNDAEMAINVAGRKLLYHNHDFEFRVLNNQYAFYEFVKHLSPTIKLEIDTYLLAVGGADPLEVIRFLSNRVELLHVKDGSISPPNLNLAVGEGVMDYATIIRAIPTSVSWLVVELENCATDMLEAVRKSAQYLDSISSEF